MLKDPDGAAWATIRTVPDALEAWGGAECTINRVGDLYRDQLHLTGHDRRVGDLSLLASLQLDALRTPVLWERVGAGPAVEADWRWSDRAISALAEHRIRPIVGLIHHGSGPPHTSLIADDFATGLAAHAERVVARYPHVTEWTPVNEPLTTARFSALYGIWYPHARDERLFWLALLNQIDATRLSMRAVRRVRPDARLIQTEDLGRTYATAGLRDQAAFDNQRRWMTWDLLAGRVVPGHPLWARIAGMGLDRRLRAIADDPCPPDVIGINHYLTSDRLLDQRITRYPESTWGGNGRRAFSDIEAIRALDPAPRGLERAIDDAWKRYRLPIALTEIHNGCTREEQIRWLGEGWKTAREARARGIDVRAVTAWALFGNQGWNTLLTQDGAYEPGAFDTSGVDVRETSLATAIRERGGGDGGQPWWRRPMRLAYPAVPRPAPLSDHEPTGGGIDRPPLLILGATGTLGQALAAECRARDIAHVLTGRGEIDLHDACTVERAIERHRPWGVANAAGWVRVDEAETEPDACHAANAAGAIAVAEACARSGVRSLSFSSDLVFDGAADAPYDEDADRGPLNVYGRSKAAMEEQIEPLAGEHLIIRTAAFFSPHDSHNFAVHCVDSLARDEAFAAVADCWVSPTYVPDLCRAALDLLTDGETGLWHLTNEEPVTWHAFAQRLALATGVGDARLTAARAEDMGWQARRPAYSALTSQRGRLMPGLDCAIRRFAEARAMGTIAALQPA